MRLLGRYQAFLEQHHAAVQSAEACLGNVTWLLPERFASSEIPAELINTFCGLWSILNDHLLLKHSKPTPVQVLLQCIHQIEVLVEISSNTLTRNGQAQSKYSLLVALEAVKAAVRLLMLGKQPEGSMLLGGGLPPTSAAASVDDQLSHAFQGLGASTPVRNTQSNLAACAQFVSAAGPAGVNSNSHGTFWWQQRSDSGSEATHATASISPSAKPAAPASRQGKTAQHAAVSVCTQCSRSPDPSTGMATQCDPAQEASNPQRCGACGRLLLQAAVGAGKPDSDSAQQRRRAAQQSPWARLRQLGRRLVLCGEILATLRPLIYVALLRRWGRRSWVPWLGSLVCDLLSRAMTLRGHALQEVASEGPELARAAPYTSTSPALLQHLLRWRVSDAQTQELARRKWLLGLYLLRDPLFSSAFTCATGSHPVIVICYALSANDYTHVLRPVLGRMTNSVAWVPVLGTLFARAVELVEGAQGYYVYTSGS